jgi:hypothetical protein
MNEETEPLCGTSYWVATSGDDDIVFTCGMSEGHDGAHYADVHGRNTDERRIAVLRWRT